MKIKGLKVREMKYKMDLQMNSWQIHAPTPFFSPIFNNAYSEWMSRYSTKVIWIICHNTLTPTFFLLHTKTQREFSKDAHTALCDGFLTSDTWLIEMLLSFPFWHDNNGYFSQVYHHSSTKLKPCSSLNPNKTQRVDYYTACRGNMSWYKPWLVFTIKG